MQVIELKHFGSPDHFHEREKAPPIPKKGEVRIKIVAMGFNPVDYKLREGRYGGNLPMILGSDCAGVIDAVGEGVENFSKGDEVYAFVYSHTSNGTYAQEVALPVAYVAKKPKNLSFEEAASIPLAALTGYRLVSETRPVSNGDTVFIRPPAETRPLRAGFFKITLGGGTKPPPTTQIPGLKAWVHLCRERWGGILCHPARSHPGS